jgi:xylulokinase
MMFDVRKHDWSTEILHLLGINKKQLAMPMASGSLVGKLDKQITANLGLADGAIVVTGGHDQPCAALGAGVTRSGMGMYATGSVECITPAFELPVFSDDLRRYNLCTYDHVVNEMYVTVAFSLTGGNILKWFRDEFGHEEVSKAEQNRANAYELLLKKAGNRPSGLLVLPYFTPSGTPYFDTKTKGAILGLRLSTSRSEFIRALLEGVALEMRLNLDILEKSGIKINELRAVGGGAKSRIWTQLKADVTGRNITPLKETEAGCLGAAMLTCAAHTGKSIQELNSSWIKTGTTLYPNPKNKKLYDKIFVQYQKLYSSIKNIDV